MKLSALFRRRRRQNGGISADTKRVGGADAVPVINISYIVGHMPGVASVDGVFLI